jgi:cholesterol transport system auxiliary component
MNTLKKYFIIPSLILGLFACSFGGKPAVMVEQYALEYPPPALQAMRPVDKVIRLERFSVAQVFNHVRMVYRQKPAHYNDYAYHRWRANPGDMVGDSLLRDLRAAGIFKSVFSWRDMENTPLVLKGGVGEFYESDQADGRKAILSVHVTLMDTTSSELTKQIVFQKNYRYEEPLTEKTVQGFVLAMSRAVEKLSGEIMADICEATGSGAAVENRK